MPKTIYTNLTDLTTSKRFSFITEDVVVGGTTLAVQSIIGFESLSTSSGQVLCIGEIGNEKTEIRRTSNTSGESPSAAYKWVYLRDALQFDHPQDTKVTIIDWDRAEIQWAASVNGTKATISAYPFNITPDVPEMVNTDTSATAGFYFVRFNKTIDNSNSDYSDAIPYAGYDDNMVFSIKKRAVDELGEEIDGKVISHEFLNQELWQARREYHLAPGKRPFRRKFNSVIGTALTGSYRIELPTDVERPHTAENIYGVRIGANANMEYYDKKGWDFDYRDKPHSTLQTPYIYGLSTSIWLANGRDFGASAVINVEGVSIGVTRYEDSLSGDSLYNSLRIYSHPTGGWSASAGSDAFSNASTGLPDKFTVFADPQGSAYIYFNRVIDTAYTGQNIHVDYYRTLVSSNSDADTLDEPNYDMFADYLKAKIRTRKKKGENDITQDPDYKVWLFKRDGALKAEYLSTDIRIFPDVEDLPN